MRIKYNDIEYSRSFGVELEMSCNKTKRRIGKFLKDYEQEFADGRDVVITSGPTGWAETKRNDYWHVKYDSTCGFLGKGLDFGWEVASFIGRSSKDAFHIANASEWLKENGVQTTANCGLHVHVDTSDYNRSSMGVLLANWIKIEPFLIQMCDKSRRKNMYCNSLNGRYENFVNVGLIEQYNRKRPAGFWRNMSPKNVSSHENPEKRYTINAIGYKKGLSNSNYTRKTVELRLPECVLEKEHVLNWLRLFLNFVESTRHRKSPLNLNPCESLEELLDLLGLSGKSEFWIPGSELLNTKIWFLNKLKETELMGKLAKNKLRFISEF